MIADPHFPGVLFMTWSAFDPVFSVCVVLVGSVFVVDLADCVVIFTELGCPPPKRLSVAHDPGPVRSTKKNANEMFSPP